MTDLDELELVLARELSERPFPWRREDGTVVDANGEWVANFDWSEDIVPLVNALPQLLADARALAGVKAENDRLRGEIGSSK